jgi:hypothetical protein
MTNNYKTQHTTRGNFAFYLKDDATGRSFSADPKNPDAIPLLEWSPQINYDTDGTALILPAGPIPLEPSSGYYFFLVPTI